MENQDKLKTLDNFLFRVKQLRGYGDMNSFNLVNELKELYEVLPESPEKIDNIIKDLAAPQTWSNGKKALKDRVEHAISAAHDNS
ncbi:hypothetical protein QWY86_06685 [Pedobacter aquatilis]|uniref:hypothetical protein n=1 Tax=Pedobacter aquatilis TaxID=351343 RepID=UPI0025B29434|nr:hypothetical protein [Pedobacter aquatilis]MDN3586345.1 hypothetical protein [Pedobacter aquatilis]